MPTSPLEAAGAAIQPTAAAPLHTNEFFTGLWSNASPFGPGAVPYLYAKSYSASRYDRLVDGNDVEISPRLTLIRRPGHIVYNSSLFPPCNRFFEFRGFTATDEVIRLLADCDAGVGSPTAGTVREVTQPSTNTILWTKAATAGRTGFVSDGNILYAGDGVSTHKWVTSGKNWVANTLYQLGDFIVDPNGNIQMSMGSQTATITNVMVEQATVVTPNDSRKLTLYFSPSTPLDIMNNIALTLSGLTTVPAANGTTPFDSTVVSSAQVSFIYFGTTLPLTPYSTETGSATTGTGISGSTLPATWQTALGFHTSDGGLQWVNMGSAVQNWGGTAPNSAPVVTQTLAPTIYTSWQANTWYAPLFQIVDSNGNLQQLVGPAPPTQIKTGNAAPTWATGPPGAITTEGGGGGSNAQWKLIGPAFWIANHAYAVGDSIQVTYTYYITTTTYQWTSDGHGGFKQVPVITQTPVTVTSLFVCATAGTSNAAAPAWVNGLGTATKEAAPSTVTWTNKGTASSWPGANVLLSLATKIVDKNHNVEEVTVMGQSGAGPAEPAWNAAGQGSFTVDNTLTWKNDGPYAANGSGSWEWAYSGMNSITGEISDPSPRTPVFTPGAGMLPVIQGQGLANPPWDTIILWRTQSGGSTLLYEDEFVNPGPTQQWVYTDTNLDDSALETQFPAPVPGNNGNDPPPAGFIPQCYYLGRIWGYVANQLRWTGGPDTITGSGNSTMPTKNRFTFPAKGAVIWPTSIGLICITTSDIWAVLGQGTDISPFYAVMFQQGIGMLSQDAFCVNGSTAYAMLTSHQVVSMDPGAGEVECGFPIADAFDSFIDPAKAYLTWHQGFSKDTALYAANGSGFWYRMAAVAAPESGNVWSPAANIRAPGHVRAMASIEITPGVKKLILGPDVDGNPILMRDPSVNADNGVAYPAHAKLASVVLAQPGTTAGFQFAVTEERMIDGATPVVLRMLFDEFEDFIHIHAADWRVLRNISLDPPNLPRSKSVMVQRHWAMQDPATIIKCRHYQQDIVWATENFPNELYTNTVYGRLPEKARR